MKVVKILCLALLATCFGTQFMSSCSKVSPQQTTAKYRIYDNIDALENARQTVCDIALLKYRVSGSAILVGRIKLDDGNYQYRALTAYHVLEDMCQDMINQKSDLDTRFLCTLQPKFHGKQLQLKLKIDAIDWSMPSYDWASFTFVTKKKLACASLASKQEFQSIKPFETIYLVGCFGPFGPQARTGVISTTHNVGVWPNEQRKDRWPWNQLPENFFRFSIPAWYGDSGGAIFNRDGKLIGIVNGFTVGGWDPVSHSGAGLKTYLIIDFVQHKKDFFKIED